MPPSSCVWDRPSALRLQRRDTQAGALRASPGLLALLSTVRNSHRPLHHSRALHSAFRPNANHMQSCQPAQPRQPPPSDWLLHAGK